MLTAVSNQAAAHFAPPILPDSTGTSVLLMLTQHAWTGTSADQGTC